jgi:hypothetical protein
MNDREMRNTTFKMQKNMKQNSPDVFAFCIVNLALPMATYGARR